MFFGYALYAEWIWKDDVLIADLEELGTMDASEIYSKRLNAKEVIFPKLGEFIFPIADGRIQNPWRRSGPENIHLGTASTNSRRGSRWLSWRIRRVSSTTSWLISGCRWSDKWFLVHVRKLHISPSRWTQSQTLLAERRIIPYSTEIHWRIQKYSYEFGCQAGETHRWLFENRWVSRLARSLDRFHTIYSIGRKSSRRIHVVRVRLTRKQLTFRPDHSWPELWKSMGKHAKLKEKQKWSNVKFHLGNARKLRGIYFIDPIKNARKKLETSSAPAIPCKMKNCGSGGSDKNTTKLACILEAESTRVRMGISKPHHHQDHIAGKGENSLQHYNLVHKFIPMLHAMKIPAAKAAVDMGKLEKISAWNLTKVKSKKQVIDEARTSGDTVHFASLMDVSSEKCWIGGKAPKIQRSSCIPR